ncbi:hypothetical protein AVDCRST_MAG92-3453 [uncultured Coleofasciculus sp.]|uniref:Uncharacterized protein n=1 Tax=uncultured Coleofasciculus sp. TaxID=1267456 RepID=A0A6J4JI76_9CYAN|nr:hypothetical protein AVDCRST_MAG92-3453 [uncultured Coleofasciculus sp.]
MFRNELSARICQPELLGLITLALISRSRSHPLPEESVNQCRQCLADNKWQQESGA